MKRKEIIKHIEKTAMQCLLVSDEACISNIPGEGNVLINKALILTAIRSSLWYVDELLKDKKGVEHLDAEQAIKTITKDALRNAVYLKDDEASIREVVGKWEPSVLS